jgi:putative transposase
MAHVFHQLYYHVTWAIHSRDPLINRSWRSEMLVILEEEVNNRGGHAIRQNAMPDHVHLLLRLPPNLVIADFIGTVKGATAFRVNAQLHPKFKLRWQEGYGILSLRKDELKKVSAYIDDQEEHHRKGKLSKLLEMTEISKPDWPPRGESPLKGAKGN